MDARDAPGQNPYASESLDDTVQSQPNENVSTVLVGLIVVGCLFLLVYLLSWTFSFIPDGPFAFVTAGAFAFIIPLTVGWGMIWWLRK